MKVCAIHPEVNGRRHANGRCASCANEAAAQRRSNPAYAARYKTYYKQYSKKNAEKKRAYMREYRKKYPAKVATAYRNWYKKSKTSGRWRATGFTADLFSKALELQSWRCAICERDLKALPEKQRHADHCHKTKQPRGVLCAPCNFMLGAVKDNPQILRRAIAYLEKPTL